MKVNFFIDRPIFSAVLSILIVIVGIIGLMMLPIDQYPQITPPVVKISASYPGASAVTVSQAVATPIEQELNGTPGMIYMESNSSNSGGFSATVTFDISADPDLAAVEIQNRIKLAESRLPAEVIQNGISVEKQAPSQLMTICLTSDDPKFDEIYLSNFATLNVLDLLRRIPGVGRISNADGLPESVAGFSRSQPFCLPYSENILGFGKYRQPEMHWFIISLISRISHCFGSSKAWFKASL